MRPVKMPSTTDTEKGGGPAGQRDSRSPEASGVEERGSLIEDYTGPIDEQVTRQSDVGWMDRDSGFPFRSDEISRYHLIMRLGRGGMARVYLACTRTGLSKLMVLKVLEPHLTRDPAARVAFHKEATLSALMSHPNVVQVHEVFEADGTPVMVMEYLEGWSLSEVLKATNCNLPLRMNLMILGQVLNALHYVHEMTDLEGKPLGAVHRDVSPNNIMILPSGFAKVLDFGIAKATIEGSTATETGIIKGKLRYMAPEQLMGGILDRRVDIFAAGVILWEMLARRRMWSQVPDSQVVGALAHGALPDLPDYVDVPEQLRDAVRCATARQPKDRFDTAQEFAQVLGSVAATLGPPPSASEVKAHLGEALNDVIRKRRELIKKAVKEASSSSFSSLSLDELPIVEAGTPSSSSKLSVAGSERSGTVNDGGLSASTSGELVWSSRRTKRWKLAALALGVLLVGTTVVMTQLSGREPDDAQSRLAATVPQKVKVLAQPTSATIFVNGVEQDHNPAEFPAPTGSWRLKVMSSGHETFDHVYEGAPQSPISVHLEPSKLAPVPSASVSSAPAPAQAETPKRAWQPRVIRSAAPKQPAPEQAPKPSAERPAPNCSPPYYYDAEGTKIFRKECF
ncbi:MAG: protein kinase [Polyangiaceae bacterium]